MEPAPDTSPRPADSLYHPRDRPGAEHPQPRVAQGYSHTCPGTRCPGRPRGRPFDPRHQIPYHSVKWAKPSPSPRRRSPHPFTRSRRLRVCPSLRGHCYPVPGAAFIADGEAAVVGQPRPGALDHHLRLSGLRAAVPQTCRAGASSGWRCSHVGFAAGGPDHAGGRVLADEPDNKVARAPVRDLEADRGPGHWPHRPAAGHSLPVQRRHPAGAVPIADGTLVTTQDRSIASCTKNYRYSINHQVVIDANTSLVVAAARPLPSSRHDARAFRESGVDQVVKNATVLGDGEHRGTAALTPPWPRKNRPLTEEEGVEFPRRDSPARPPLNKDQATTLPTAPVTRPDNASNSHLRKWRKACQLSTRLAVKNRETLGKR
ncbi:transposase [Streptomyces sp. KLMMK]|uniref:transposase n=1 Tax=Streptomyces sp. KLMMK TaxID=3109353 RepID=UPI003FA7AAA7